MEEINYNNFRIVKKSNKSNARLGVLKTIHGNVKTPFFMPCATQGVVKTISTNEMKKLGAEILLANTYHLMLEPGERLIKQAGGLHKFINWDKPILTDSGGFQVFSLAGTKNSPGKITKSSISQGKPVQSLVKLTGKGVKFKSYINGKEYYLTPEKSLKIQVDLGVDIAVGLDVCLALPAKKKDVEKAVDLTTYWAKKTKHLTPQPPLLIRRGELKGRGVRPLLFAVIQGGLDKKLRLKSLRELVKIGFDGYNIGGLSVGETDQEMQAVLDYLVSEMPENKPRYLMGVGYPEQIVKAVKQGIDMFDCVIPTREGRHGRLFSFKKKSKLQITNYKLQNFYQAININRSKFTKDFSPINPNSKLPELRQLSKAYLHYLFKIKEPLSMRLASLNNLEFYLNLMQKIQKSIKAEEI